jgi:hypothetical protein
MPLIENSNSSLARTCSVRSGAMKASRETCGEIALYGNLGGTWPDVPDSFSLFALGDPCIELGFQHSVVRRL